MIKRMQRAFLRTALAGAIGLGLAAGQASAYSLYPNVTTQFEDNDIELLVNAPGSPNNTLLEVGDKLRGVLSIDALNATGFPSQVLMGGNGANLGNEEITGIFEIEVKTAVLTGTGWNFTFGPSADFEAVYGTNAVLALFNDAVGDLVLITADNSCDKTSQAECENRATDGTPMFVFGFGDLDAQWDAYNVGTNDVSIVAAGAEDFTFGSYNFALNLLANSTGYNLADRNMVCGPPPLFACAGDGKIELLGSGSILGGENLQSGYDARSDFQFGIRAIPEPGTLGLLGLGLAAAAGLSRRRKA